MWFPEFRFLLKSQNTPVTSVARQRHPLSQRLQRTGQAFCTEARSSAYVSAALPPQAVQPWACELTFPCLGLLIYKMGTT